MKSWSRPFGGCERRAIVSYAPQARVLTVRFLQTAESDCNAVRGMQVLIAP